MNEVISGDFGKNTFRGFFSVRIAALYAKVAATMAICQIVPLQCLDSKSHLYRYALSIRRTMRLCS